MSLTVTRARVKEKSGITGTTYDTTIDNLIAELVSVIEFSLHEEYLADTGNAGLQATLTLGATEIVCGEILAQLLRADGIVSDFDIKEVLATQDWWHLSDPYALRSQGLRRLRPYLKLDPRVPVASGVLTGTDRDGLEGAL